MLKCRTGWKPVLRCGYIHNLHFLFRQAVKFIDQPVADRFLSAATPPFSWRPCIRRKPCNTTEQMPNVSFQDARPCSTEESPQSDYKILRLNFFWKVSTGFHRRPEARRRFFPVRRIDGTCFQQIKLTYGNKEHHVVWFVFFTGRLHRSFVCTGNGFYFSIRQFSRGNRGGAGKSSGADYNDVCTVSRRVWRQAGS